MQLLLALKARIRARQLDAALAGGADPASSAELAQRARQLTSPRLRSKLADGLETALATPDASRGTSAAVHPAAPVIRAAGPSMRALASQLRFAAAVEPRGVVLVRRLLTDPTSPLHAATSTDEAVRAVETTREALR